MKNTASTLKLVLLLTPSLPAERGKGVSSKKSGLLISLAFIFLFLFPINAFSWGFYAHKKINRMAVYGVPSPLSAFYKRNIDYITKHAVDPDKKRFVDSAEGPHHYINLDHYGANPFAVLPKYWKDAAKKYTEDTLNKY